MIKTEKTKIFRVNDDQLASEDLTTCLDVLNQGGLLIVPTDTVYGIVCNAFDPRAIQKIYDLKGRNYTKPLPILLSSSQQLGLVATDLPKEIFKLVDSFWPGPLTVVVRTAPIVLHASRGKETIAVRVPDHGVIKKILDEKQIPIVATSANLSGRPSLQRGIDVIDAFSESVDVIVDGGSCPIGQESSVVDATHFPFTVLREGALLKEDLLAAIN
ncbi:threonylcarbamoyl-AMP synthase [bacterium F11]|nr:threonylcarbamoyl-AMP synthase [bacterium F11]